MLKVKSKWLAFWNFKMATLQPPWQYALVDSQSLLKFLGLKELKSSQCVRIYNTYYASLFYSMCTIPTIQMIYITYLYWPLLRTLFSLIVISTGASTNNYNYSCTNNNPNDFWIISKSVVFWWLVELIKWLFLVLWIFIGSF